MNLSKLSDQELDELAADARSVVSSKGFQHVMAGLRSYYVQELVRADVGSLTASSYHARMKVLDDVEASFKTINNEQVIRKKK